MKNKFPIFLRMYIILFLVLTTTVFFVWNTAGTSSIGGLDGLISTFGGIILPVFLFTVLGLLWMSKMASGGEEYSFAGKKSSICILKTEFSGAGWRERSIVSSTHDKGFSSGLSSGIPIFEFNLEFDEYQAKNIFRSVKNDKASPPEFLFAAVAILICFVIGLLLIAFAAAYDYYLPSYIFTLIFLVVSIAVRMHKKKQAVYKNLGATAYSFYPSYFTATKDGKPDTTDYSEVYMVKETPLAFILCANSGNIYPIIKESLPLGESDMLRQLLQSVFKKKYKKKF